MLKQKHNPIQEQMHSEIANSISIPSRLSKKSVATEAQKTDKMTVLNYTNKNPCRFLKSLSAQSISASAARTV